MNTDELTRADLELLEFARVSWTHRGRKETVVRERFGITLTRYEQRLQALLAHPAAAVYDAQLVTRLNRLQQRRAQARRGGFTTLDEGATR